MTCTCPRDPDWLCPHEVERLTGYRRPDCQARELRARRIRHTRTRRGVTVARAWVTGETAAPRERVRPNLEALR